MGVSRSSYTFIKRVLMKNLIMSRSKTIPMHCLLQIPVLAKSEVTQALSTICTCLVAVALQPGAKMSLATMMLLSQMATTKPTEPESMPWNLTSPVIILCMRSVVVRSVVEDGVHRATFALPVQTVTILLSD